MAVPSPDAKPVCVECGKSCIAMCPYCKVPVHHGYGLENSNCSGKHEQQCSGARWARQPEGSK
jgi:hypothetical protein